MKLKSTLRGFFSKGSSQTSIDGEFATESQEKRLRIVIWANGLGKDHLADIIPTDIESFKDSIEAAISTMQDASTGIVTSMEVAPWIENIQFQRYLELGDANQADGQQRRIDFRAR